MVERVCIVTGASRGIGAAIARCLAVEGYRVVGVSRSAARDPALDEHLRCDLDNPHDLDRLCGWIRDQKAIWGLVNNAAVHGASTLADTHADEMERIYRMNAVVPALLTQACVTRMAGGGRVVNVSSAAARGQAARGPYGASKLALHSLTRTWALELASQKITVNAVVAGPMRTEMYLENHPPGSPSQAAFMRDIPMGRIGEPAELAQLVAFLVKPEMCYLTGQCIVFDGGYTTGRGAPD